MLGNRFFVAGASEDDGAATETAAGHPRPVDAGATYGEIDDCVKFLATHLKVIS